MTQEIINTYFNSELGKQCYILFSTPDDRVFIRFEEASKHCIDNNFHEDSISRWFDENEDAILTEEIKDIICFIEEKAEHKGWENAEYLAVDKFGEDKAREAILAMSKNQ